MMTNSIFDFISNKIKQHFAPNYYNPSPQTMRDWNMYYSNFEQEHPTVVKILDIMEKVEDIFYYLPRKILNFRYKIRNKYFYKYHYLKSDLDSTEYYDLDTRILHGLFNELVTFVEVECTHMQCWCDKEAKQKYNLPFYSNSKWKFLLPEIRSEQAGIDFIKYQVDSGSEEHNKIIALYYWWKYIRLNRKDPYDSEAITDFSNSMELKYNTKINIWNMRDVISEEEGEYLNNIYKKMSKLEESYYLEDTKMLEELIKIRSYLWT